MHELAKKSLPPLSLKDAATQASWLWSLELLSVVLNGCPASATQTGSGLFLPFRATSRLWFKAQHQTHGEVGGGGDFLLTMGPGVGWTKSLAACLTPETRLICDFDTRARSPALNSVRWDVTKNVCVCVECLAASSHTLQALQSVGNLGLQLGHGKEQWMAPLHPIILRSVSSVKDFLDKLIDIDHDTGETESTPLRDDPRAVPLVLCGQGC